MISKTICKMICGDCKKYMKCPNAGTVFTECVYEEQYWESFRAEAAKDVLCAIIASPSIIKLKDDKGNLIEFRKEHACEVSIQYADELIKQLKEKEESK